jgi:hypothetical protein
MSGIGAFFESGRSPVDTEAVHEAMHEIVKRPLPFRISPSHICRKPAETSASQPFGLLTGVNGAGGEPNEDA